MFNNFPNNENHFRQFLRMVVLLLRVRLRGKKEIRVIAIIPNFKRRLQILGKFLVENPCFNIFSLKITDDRRMP